MEILSKSQVEKWNVQIKEAAVFADKGQTCDYIIQYNTVQYSTVYLRRRPGLQMLFSRCLLLFIYQHKQHHHE